MYKNILSIIGAILLAMAIVISVGGVFSLYPYTGIPKLMFWICALSGTIFAFISVFFQWRKDFGK